MPLLPPALNAPVETIPLPGFDPDGEPEARLMPDGSLHLAFRAMPPAWAADGSAFAAFHRRLGDALGIPVTQEHPRLFRIRTPALDTLIRTARFLRAMRNRAP